MSHDPSTEPGGLRQPDDDELLALLGRALAAAEPVPEHVAVGARAAMTWRTIDDELAEIVFDSAVDTAGVRAEQMDRQLTFRAPGVEIEVMVVDSGTRRLIGQLVPPEQATVELAAHDVVRTTESDALGRFDFDELVAGPVRLTVLGPSGTPLVRTEWVIV